MPSMYIENNQFFYPREGAGMLLQMLMDRICSDAPAQLDLTLMLFENDLVPDDVTVFADLTPATFDGYAAIVLNDTGDCSGFVQGPAIGSDLEWRIFIDQQQFTMSGVTTPGSVYGAALVDATAETILGIVRFPDAPLVMDETGDVIKVSGPLIVLPFFTPVP